MPKVPNSRKFLKSVRQSASPLASTNGPEVSTFSLADHSQFSDMKSGDLLEVIRSRLRHQLPSERCVGTDMISTFLTTKRLAQFKSSQTGEIVKLLALLLLDRAENVRFGAIDALCYLSSLSDESCDLLVANDILKQLLPMFELYFLSIDSWTQPKVTDKKLTLNLYVDCFNLLTNLCGASSQFTETLLSHTKIVDIFRKGFQTVLEPHEKVSFVPIAIATAQCLSVICEDERIYARMVLPNADSPTLSDVLSHIATLDLSTITDVTQAAAQLYLKSLVISVASLHQFKPEFNSEVIVKEELITKLSIILEQIYSVDANQALGILLTQLVERVKQDLSSECRNLHEMIPLYEQIKYRYLTKRNCMELLTNLLVSFDVDEDGEGECEELDDEDDEMEMMDSAEESGSSNCDPLVVGLCKEKKILEVLIAEFSAVNSIPVDAVEILSKHVYGKDLVATIQTSKISALTLIHNLIASKIVTQSDAALEPTWQLVYDGAFKVKQPEESDQVLLELEIEIREEAINVVREFVANFKDITLTMTDLEALCTFAQQHSSVISSFTKVNIVRVMALVASGTIIRAMAAPTEPIAQFVEQITNLLLTGYRADSDLILRAEILDSLIDVFSDDNQLTLLLIKRMNLLVTLKEIAVQYKNEMKCNARLVQQNAVVSTVGLNLNRFIKYKQKVIR